MCLGLEGAAAASRGRDVALVDRPPGGMSALPSWLAEGQRPKAKLSAAAKAKKLYTSYEETMRCMRRRGVPEELAP